MWSTTKLFHHKKYATFRNKKYGEVGNVFDVSLPDGNFQTYELIGQVKMPLWVVAKFLWRIECAISEQDFINVWNDIHPRKRYEDDINHEVWVHFFVEHQP